MSDGWIEMPAWFVKITLQENDINFQFRTKMFTKNGTVKTPMNTGQNVYLSSIKRFIKTERDDKRLWAYEYVREHHPEYLI